MQLTFTPIGRNVGFCSPDSETGAEAHLLEVLRDTILELDLLTSDEYDGIVSGLHIEVIPDNDLPKLVAWFNQRCDRWQVTISNN